MILLASALAASGASAQSTKFASSAKSAAHDAKTEVAALLTEFLSNVDSAAMHERFWADNLIYVGNSGSVKTKADIVKSMKESEAKDAAAKKDGKKSDGPKETFSAEDVTIRQYGDIAVLNFRLVQHTVGAPDNSYRNSGVFTLRDGKWQVISWQATKVQPVSDTKK
jgi:hypothetical protein